MTRTTTPHEDDKNDDHDNEESNYDDDIDIDNDDDYENVEKPRKMRKQTIHPVVTLGMFLPDKLCPERRFRWISKASGSNAVA